MNMSKKDRAGLEGRLPAMAPLANPYVPFQLEDPPKYEPRMALVRGTLYPGLDLLFMGMVNTEEKPITPRTELQVLGFALHELALYLDTHRNDKDALEIYTKYQCMYKEAKEAYEKKYGPLTHMSGCTNAYRWLDDPWPWEYSAHREG